MDYNEKGFVCINCVILMFAPKMMISQEYCKGNVFYRQPTPMAHQLVPWYMCDYTLLARSQGIVSAVGILLILPATLNRLAAVCSLSLLQSKTVYLGVLCALGVVTSSTRDGSFVLPFESSLPSILTPSHLLS